MPRAARLQRRKVLRIIDPLWGVARADGADTDTLPDTCTDCHSVRAGPDIPCTLTVNNVVVSQPVPQTWAPLPASTSPRTRRRTRRRSCARTTSS